MIGMVNQLPRRPSVFIGVRSLSRQPVLDIRCWSGVIGTPGWIVLGGQWSNCSEALRCV